jgi:hypothetical protein
MDNFKYNLGPFEMFSNLLSGIFILAGICIIIFPKSDFHQLFNMFSTIPLMPNLIIYIILSYILGAGIGGVSYAYLKFLCKVFRQDYISMENTLLKDLNDLKVKIKIEDFYDLPFEKRLAYMVNQYIALPKLSHVNDYLLPYLRDRCSNVAAKSDTFISSSIMNRNLSFGFLVAAFGFLSCIIFSESTWITFLIVILICLMLAVFFFFRSLKFKEWWSREVLLGFYYKNIEEIQKSTYLFVL